MIYIPGAQSSPTDHVKDSPGCSRHHVLTVVQLSDVLAQVGSSDAGVALDVHVVAQGQHHLLDLDRQLPGGGQAEHLGLPDGRVDALQDGDGEGCSLSCSGLSLSDHIPALDDWLDGSLLDG